MQDAPIPELEARLAERLRHDRRVISVPIGQHYRLIFREETAGLRPFACVSHSDYNGVKPGERR